MSTEIEQQFCRILGQEQVALREPMRDHTTFRIGGPADYFLMPRSSEEILQVLEICRQAQIPFFILGHGSNLLVSDSGYRGAVIQIFRNFSAIWREDSSIRVQAGALLVSVSRKAAEAGLTGLEFAGGIPGTMGGAVVMNAGAYGGEMREVLDKITVLTQDGQIEQLTPAQLRMGYRTSSVKSEKYVVLEALVQLQSGERDKISERMNELAAQRSSKQPLEYPSAGSTFKRPEGYYAGKLIMDAGLRGFRVGDAQVSEKHCGFVINRGHATAAQVRQLMREIQERVVMKFGVKLEPEVQFLGDFDNCS